MYVYNGYLLRCTEGEFMRVLVIFWPDLTVLFSSRYLIWYISDAVWSSRIHAYNIFLQYYSVGVERRLNSKKQSITGIEFT